MPAALRCPPGPPSLGALLLIALALLASAPRANAQIRIAGAVAGTVTDTSDAVVPGATVQLMDELTGIVKDTVTNDSGGFNQFNRGNN